MGQVLKSGNCECGNHCYTIRQQSREHLPTPGTIRFEVQWFHDPSECPYDCEDCENEGSVRAEVDLI